MILVSFLSLYNATNSWAEANCIGSNYSSWHNCIGTFSNNDGLSYVGQWRMGQPNGWGKYLYKNGDIYEGNVNQGRRHGFGKYTYSDGTRFEGRYDSGLRNGEGIVFYKDGTKKTGDWKDGVFIKNSSTAANILETLKNTGKKGLSETSRRLADSKTSGKCQGMPAGKLADFVEANRKFIGFQEKVSAEIIDTKAKKYSRNEATNRSNKLAREFNNLIQNGRGKVFRVCADTETIQEISRNVNAAELLLEALRVERQKLTD